MSVLNFHCRRFITARIKRSAKTACQTKQREREPNNVFPLTEEQQKSTKEIETKLETKLQFRFNFNNNLLANALFSTGLISRVCFA
jgi:hypothetical protein